MDYLFISFLISEWSVDHGKKEMKKKKESSRQDFNFWYCTTTYIHTVHAYILYYVSPMKIYKNFKLNDAEET